MKHFFAVVSMLTVALTATAQNDDFTITVDDITWKDAHVTVTPKNPLMKYYYSSMTIEKINEDPTIAGDIEKIPDFDYAWWKYVGGINVNEVIQADLVSGKLDTRTMSEDYTNMFRWNSQGVFYCYGVNKFGKMSTPLYYVVINTLGPTEVDMDFDVDIEEMQQTSVKATITPSKADEPYFVSIERPSFLEAYQDDLEEMQCKLLKAYTEDYVFTGTLQTRESVFPLKARDQDYNFVIFGFNNGPTTPITIVPFRTLTSGSSSQYRFECLFLNEEGDDINRLYMDPIAGEEGAYTYLVQDGAAVAEIWKSLTGYPIPESEEINYKYADSKYDVAYEIKASKVTTDGCYGVMTCDLYDYPEIRKIVFVDHTYALAIESVANDRTAGQPKSFDLWGRPAQKHTGISIRQGKKSIVQ